jgi:hypothetical protein
LERVCMKFWDCICWPCKLSRLHDYSRIVARVLIRYACVINFATVSTIRQIRQSSSSSDSWGGSSKCKPIYVVVPVPTPGWGEGWGDGSGLKFPLKMTGVIVGQAGGGPAVPPPPPVLGG